ARRLGLAMKAIRAGDSVIDAQLTASYDSSSGFREAFIQTLGTAPSKLGDKQPLLTATWLDTPLGAMLAVTDEQALYLLEFVDRRALETELVRLRKRYTILPGKTQISQQLLTELDAYFAGTSSTFQTPLHLMGTTFQTSVWQHLQTIPAGQTYSYKHLANALGKPTAVRAVAAANGANQLAILVPCHRVIGSDGNLRGYGGGLARKRWLLEHEVAHFS
ncbi:MAG: methylated-DNA--[protein]-cysteine S-methyltransferase, partial [Deinococcota bacterium]